MAHHDLGDGCIEFFARRARSLDPTHFFLFEAAAQCLNRAGDIVDLALDLRRFTGGSEAAACQEFLDPIVEPLNGRLHFRGAVSLAAHVARQGVDAIVQGVDRGKEGEFALIAAAGRSGLLRSLREVVKPLGKVFEPLFDGSRRALRRRALYPNGFVRRIPDRAFQPFADGKAGSPCGVPGRSPRLRINRAHAPGHACGHCGSRSRRAGL